MVGCVNVVSKGVLLENDGNEDGFKWTQKDIFIITRKIITTFLEGKIMLYLGIFIVFFEQLDSPTQSMQMHVFKHVDIIRFVINIF